MGFDPFILPVINRSQIQSRFQGSESPLHFHQLFVPQCHILRTQGVVTGGNDVFPVQMGLFSDLPFVDFDPPVFQLPQVSAHGPVGQKGADVLRVTVSGLLFDGLQSFFNLFDGLLASGLILFGFIRIVNQDKAAALFPVANDHFLDLQVFPNGSEPAPLGQNLAVGLLIVPELLADDVVTAGLLQDQAILFGTHPTVHDPDAAAPFPAEKIAFDLLHGLHVRRVSRHRPALYRDALLRDRQADPLPCNGTVRLQEKGAKLFSCVHTQFHVSPSESFFSPTIRER
ncbi:MAG: hypothetical protein A4E70_01090 [Syntrophus sp. PtaU1.Bin005]|nr:MAG: hypothetical protein A4E70_01090 [Syntrophus sp. PtaU1.Bin005]